MKLSIRNIEERDGEALFAWVAGLGWNPGEKDAQCLLATDPKGMLMAELDGRPVGCATSIAYDDQFGFVGALVVDPALRGKAPRYVLQLYRAISVHMRDRNVGMDATPASELFFRSTGFTKAYRHFRFEGSLSRATPSGDVVPLARIPFAELCDYDATCFPARRERFLENWLDAYADGGFACLRNGRLAGFGVLRRALRGFRAGPLLADDAAAAETLLHAMNSLADGAPVALDIPEPNAPALSLAEKLQLARRFATARLYRHSIPATPQHRTFAIASYEFG
jgi:hypothetical protein